MKLKIVSDGTPFGTEVIDENGNRIDNIVRLEWKANADDDSCECTIHLMDIEFIGEAESEAKLCTRRLKTIEYADGEIVNYE